MIYLDSTNGYAEGDPVADALIRNGALKLPGKDFGNLMDGMSGIKRRTPKKNSQPAQEHKFPHKPGDYGMFTLSTPTAIAMFEETETRLMEAASALKELYELINPDFSSQRTIERSIKRLEGALDRWQRIYGGDLIMQDTGSDYVGADAVAESYLAKNFKITTPEAVGALRHLIKRKFPEQRTYRTNDNLPMGRLLIIDCQPQIETDPKYFFVYRIPKDRNVDGSGIKTAAYVMRVKKAA